MRLLLPLLIAGCARSAPPELMLPPANDPLALGEKTFRIESLPGDSPLRWPIPVAFSDGAWILPWHDADGWHLRRTDSDDSISDLAVDAEPKGVCAVRGGFAVGFPGSVRFLDGNTISAPIPTELDGPIACADGAVLVAEDRSAALVTRSTLLRFELPHAAPWLFGDAGGFVAGDWLVSIDGEVTRAPAPLVADARLYLQSPPAGDRVSLDGLHWIDAGGRLTWASPEGTTAVVDGQVVLGLDEGGMRTRGRLPRSVLADSSWLTARMGNDLVWEGAVGEDRALVLLRGGSLVATSGWVRVPAPYSRTVVVSPGEASVLVTWLGADGHVRLAVWTPEIP